MAVGVGWSELLIVLIVGGGVLLSLLVVGIVLFVVLRSRSQMGGSSSQLGQAAGPPTRIRLLTPSEKPICSSARWDGGELLVDSAEWASKSLFDVALENCDQCMLSYRFRIKTDNLQTAVYPEMWCRVPEKGQYFSRGVNQKVRGTNDWKEVEIPFYLQADQRADLVHLNLVFEGEGKVKLKDIEVLSTPLKAG